MKDGLESVVESVTTAKWAEISEAYQDQRGTRAEMHVGHHREGSAPCSRARIEFVRQGGITDDILSKKAMNYNIPTCTIF